MTDGLGIAILAGLGGMLGWGGADFLAKKTIDRIGDLPSLFWAQAIGVVPLLVLFATSQRIPSVAPVDVLWLVLLGAGSALSYLSLYAGFGKGQVSFLSPVFASHAALVVFLSAVVFGERINGYQWMAISVVLVGVILISTNPSDLRRVLREGGQQQTAGLPQVLGAGVAYAFWLVLFDRFLNGRDWVFFLLMIRITAACTLASYAAITNGSIAIPRPLRRPLRGYLGSIGLLDVAAFAAVSWGFSATTHTSVITVLSSAFSVPTLLLARIFLDERLIRPQKIAAGVILAGIALVSIA